MPAWDQRFLNAQHRDLEPILSLKKSNLSNYRCHPPFYLNYNRKNGSGHRCLTFSSFYSVGKTRGRSKLVSWYPVCSCWCFRQRMHTGYALKLMFAYLRTKKKWRESGLYNKNTSLHLKWHIERNPNTTYRWIAVARWRHRNAVQRNWRDQWVGKQLRDSKRSADWNPSSNVKVVSRLTRHRVICFQWEAHLNRPAVCVRR